MKSLLKDPKVTVRLFLNNEDGRPKVISTEKNDGYRPDYIEEKIKM